MNVVIADAGPVIALSRIDKLELLQHLFGRIIITDTVRDEILVNHHASGKALIQQAIDDGWIAVHPVAMKSWKPLNSGVDAGEASAIFLAMQSIDDSLLIIDDQAGRAEARYRKITLMGTAAVVGAAKLEGHIPSACIVLQELRAAGYYIADAIIETVLLDIGEEFRFAASRLPI